MTEDKTLLERYVERIKSIRASVEQTHDAQPTDAHLARMMLVGQMQILDAVISNARDFAEQADKRSE